MNKKQEFIDKHAPRYHTRSVVFEQDLTSLIEAEQVAFIDWYYDNGWSAWRKNHHVSIHHTIGPKTTTELLKEFNERGK
jgi:hypothetical protein